jgi:hypothetical protein
MGLVRDWGEIGPQFGDSERLRARAVRILEAEAYECQQ